MLDKAPVMPVLPVTNLKRARGFYEEKLGLNPSGEIKNRQVNYKCGNGSTLHLYERSEPTKADHTAVTFEVNNVESSVKELSKKGVVFEEYDMPGLKTVNGIARVDGEIGAWFKDTEGNILCVHQII